MIMKGNTEWENERIDLPSLTSLTGDMYTLMSIGSITLESTSLWIDWFRYPAVVIWRYPSRSWLLLLYLFASFVKCVWLLSFISRCWWSRVFHHKQMVEGISLVFILSAPVCLFPVTLWVFLPMILKVLVNNYWFQKAYYHQRAPQEPLLFSCHSESRRWRKKRRSRKIAVWKWRESDVLVLYQTNLWVQGRESVDIFRCSSVLDAAFSAL